MSQPSSLDYRGSQLTASDLAILREHQTLSALTLEESQLDDARLESLRDLTGLTVLNLTRTQISDAGLVHLHRMKSLRFLILHHAPITDAALGHLAALPQLEYLGLNGTAVTPGGVERLTQLLAGCEIEADFAAPKPPLPSQSMQTSTESVPFDGSSHIVSGRSPASDASVPIHFGRYYIIKQLGEGRMGTVLLAHDEQLDRKVALKIPKISPDEGPDGIERFYQEARLAAKLHHRNICPIFDVGEIEGRPYLSMAYLEGKELTHFIQSKKRQPEVVVATVVRKLALALREAHANGVLHRDLKPANVMIDKQREPVVMDFGLARTIVHGDSHVAENGAVLGTPAYMAPEQLDGDLEKLGPHSDVFSLGVLFYELLTGQLPFQGTIGSVLKQIASKDPPKLSELRPGLSPQLEEICLKMLSKRVEDRYKSMSGVAVAITEYLKTAKNV